MKFIRTISGDHNKEIIVIFPQWKSPRFLYSLISKRLSKRYCVITYYYSSDILVSNVGEVLENFKKVLKDANDVVRLLPKKTVNVLAFSIGSYLAFMFAKANQRVAKMFIVASGSPFSEFVWGGKSTKGIKKKMIKQRLSLSTLGAKWMQLSPSYQMKNIKSRVFLILSKGDKVIPYNLGVDLIHKLDVNKVKYKSKVHKHISHSWVIFKYLVQIYFSGMFPNFDMSKIYNQSL